MVKKNPNLKPQTSKQNLNSKFKKLGILGMAVLLTIFTAVLAFAQDAVFTASVDKERITLGGQVELTLTVTGSQDTDSPELPKLEEFNVVSSGTSSQFSFVNGRMSASKNFSYSLAPLKEGNLTIPPVSINAGGQILKTQAINIEVVNPVRSRPAEGTAVSRQDGTASNGVKSSSAAVTNAAGAQAQTQPQEPPQTAPISREALKDRVFIRVSADKNTAYVGEQITMTFKLYHRGVMINNIQYTPPVTKGFVTEQMGQQKEYREALNGAAYDVVELKTAIFPATAGELTIGPAKLKCDLLVKGQKERRRTSGMYDDFFDDFFQDPFFGNYTKYPMELESDPVKVSIRQFPSIDRPDSFKGAIGTFDMTTEASPVSLKAGEPINLIMKIKGEGNITQAPEPAIRDLTGFRGYDSEVKTDITGRDPRIAGEKVFQKVIIPQDEKVKEIPVIEFSFFDPAADKYNTIRKGPIPITVSPAPKKETEIVELVKQIGSDEEAKQAVKLLAKDIHYIEKSPGRFTRIGAYWYKNVLSWILIIIAPILVLGGSYIFNIYRTRLREDKVYAKAKGAGKIARALLDEAIKYQKQNKVKEFYDGIARALQKYMSDRLNVPIGAIVTSNIETLLVSREVRQDTIDAVKKLLDTCDMIRFGAQTAAQAEMKHVIKEASEIIAVLSKKI